METTGLFSRINPDTKFTQLSLITKDRIELFLPGLCDELFKTPKSGKDEQKQEVSVVHETEQLPQECTNQTEIQQNTTSEQTITTAPTPQQLQQVK